jgi:aspartokinase
MTNQGERYVETIAVYREERVKVYGISRREELGLAIVSFPPQYWGTLGEQLERVAASVGPFEMVTGQAVGETVFELQLLLPGAAVPELITRLECHPGIKEAGATWRTVTPVTMLYLHGPHFQERYGIAETAFAALAAGGIEILIAGCAGTSMCLVTPGHQGDQGLQNLQETFLIPTTP